MGSPFEELDSARLRAITHNVRYYRSGVQPFRQPVASNLTLCYNALDLSADPRQTMIVYAAEPGSPSDESLRLLAGWTPAPDQVTDVRADHEG